MIFNLLRRSFIAVPIAVCLTVVSFARNDASLFTKPLDFAPEENKIQITSPQLNFALKEGGRFEIGGQIIESSKLIAFLDERPRANTPRKFRESNRSSASVFNIGYTWPQAMVSEGELSVTDAKGKIFWSKPVMQAQLTTWQDQQAYDDQNILKPLYGSSYGALDVDPTKLPFLQNGAPFRVCFNAKSGTGEALRSCSPLYRAARSGGKTVIAAQTPTEKVGVFVGNTSAGLSGIVNFRNLTAVQLTVRFETGGFLQFTTRPLQPKLLDIAANADKTEIIFVGQGTKPIGRVEDLYVPPNHFWAPTGLQEETVWRTSVPFDSPILKFEGAWHLPFNLIVLFDRIPNESDRIFLSQKSSTGTYIRNPNLYGLQPTESSPLASKENSLKMTDRNHFRWTFKADKKGEKNSAKVIIRKKVGKSIDEWNAHYELYRGYPAEVSGRLTGLLSTDLSINIVAELAGAYWFENFLGIDNYYLTHLRWGMSARYFMALNAITVPANSASGTTQTLSPFSTANLDFRYNLIPGLWNRDELVGLIGSAESVTLGTHSGMLIGTGLYWARTMPKVFDDLFNYVPFMRYPKYVDMELIYYPLTLDNTISPGMTYNLNFHGKVFWRKTFYGEAGFGVKSFDFYDKVGTADQSKISLNTLYGTLGLGIVF